MRHLLSGGQVGGNLTSINSVALHSSLLGIYSDHNFMWSDDMSDYFSNDIRQQSLMRTNIILAALRHFQLSIIQHANLTYLDDMISVESIETDAIDAICKRLNFGSETERILDRCYLVSGKEYGSDSTEVSIFIEASTVELAIDRFKRSLREERGGLGMDDEAETIITRCSLLSEILEERLVVPDFPCGGGNLNA